MDGRAAPAPVSAQEAEGAGRPGHDAAEARRRIEAFPRGVSGLDPRTRIALIVVTSTVCLASGGEVTVLIVLAAAVALVAASGRARIGIVCAAVYAALNLVIALTAALRVPGLSAILLVVGFTILKFVPVMALAWWFVSSVRTGELICALERARLPKAATIPLSVMVRYLPTLGQEFRCIRDTMRMRGIDSSVAGVAAHPLAAVEHVFVPLLMRCLKVADELAASAVSRGIECDVRRTAVRDVRMRVRDGVALVALAVFAAAVVVIDAGPVGQIVVWRITL